MKKYRVDYSEHALRKLEKLDKHTQSMIYAWIDKNLVDCTDPRAHGKALAGNRKGQWRYRIGDYRLVCEIQDDHLVIFALTVGHRRKVYSR